MPQTKQTAKILKELKYYIEKNQYPFRNKWENWIDYYEKTNNEYPKGRNKGRLIFKTKITSIKIDDTEISIEKNEWKTAFKEIIKFYDNDYDNDIDFIKEFESKGYEHLGEYRFIKKGTPTTTEEYSYIILPVLSKYKTDIYFKYYIPELENKQKKLKKQII